jgi:hypothetical protein
LNNGSESGYPGKDGDHNRNKRLCPREIEPRCPMISPRGFAVPVKSSGTINAKPIQFGLSYRSDAGRPFALVSWSERNAFQQFIISLVFLSVRFRLAGRHRRSVLCVANQLITPPLICPDGGGVRGLGLAICGSGPDADPSRPAPPPTGHVARNGPLCRCGGRG